MSTKTSPSMFAGSLLVLALLLLIARTSPVGAVAPEADAHRTILEQMGIEGVSSSDEFSGIADSSDAIQSGAQGEPGWPNVRIYWPSGNGPHPVVVYYQDLRSGPERDASTPGELAASADAVVIMVRTPVKTKIVNAATWVDGDEGFAAYRWALANAAALGGDPTRIAVMGDQSAASLAAVVALRAREAHIQTPAYQGVVYPSRATDAQQDATGLRVSANVRRPTLIRVSGR